MSPHSNSAQAGQHQTISDGGTTRDLKWDAIKGILIILVIVGHLIQYTGGLAANGPRFEDNGIWTDAVFKGIYMFHMPAFFFISGLFLGRKQNQSAFENIANRARQLLLPIVSLCATFHILFYIRSWSAAGTRPPIWPTIFNIYDGVLHDFWFSWVLFFCFTTVLLLRCLPAKSPCLPLALSVALLLIPVLPFYKFALFFFAIGSMAGAYSFKIKQNAGLLAGAALFWIAGYLCWNPMCYFYIGPDTIWKYSAWTILLRSSVPFFCIFILIWVITRIYRNRRR